MHRSHPLVTSLALALLAAAGLGAAPGAAAQDPPHLLAVRHGEKAQLFASRAAVAAYPVAVDRSLVAEGRGTFAVELPGSGRRVARLEGLERRGPGDLVWRGRLEGAVGGEVVLTLKHGLVVGRITAGDRLYELRPLPGGEQVLAEIDEALAPPCGGAQEVPGAVAGTAFLPSPGEPLPLAPRAAAVVDVMALYSPEARDQAGGTAAVEATIQSAVDLANTSLRNSQVAARLRLVHTGLRDRPEGPERGRELAALRSDPDVARLRNQHRADLVGLILSNALDACGRGYVMRRPGPDFARFAYQITALDCAVAVLAYAHEHGHNLGLEHDPANGPPPVEASYPWSFGHFVDGYFRTVMSYQGPCRRSCPRRAVFSNPRVTLQGQPTGIHDQRDNARTLQQTTDIAAGFRRVASGPRAPGELTAVREGLAALLSWEDRSGDEDGFRVYRASGGGPLERIAELPVGSVYFADEGLEPDTVYTYQVAAFNGRGEGRSARVEVETPVLREVSVVLTASPATVITGGSVDFVALVGGPVQRARWSFGEEGVALSPRPCGPERFCARHLFTEAGLYTAEVEVMGDLGQTARESLTIEVTGEPSPLQSRRAVIQSTIFGPRGNTGTFASDCWTHNAGAAAALLEVAFWPRGLSNPDPAVRRLTLGAGETLSLPNVLSTLFAASDTQGALGLTYSTSAGGAAPDLTTVCRSYVELRGKPGSFGQLVAGEPEAAWSAAPRRVPGALQDEDFSSSLLVVNLDDGPGRVEMELADAAGQPVGETQVFVLGARGARQRPLVQLFPAALERTGPFTVSFRSNGIRFAASTTMLETASEDQIFVAARERGAAGPLVVPRVATGSSQFGASLVSRLVAHNPAATPTTLDLELWRRGRSNLEPLTARRQVPPASTLVVDDVVGELFGLAEGVGALVVRWANAEDVAPQLLTYSLNGSGAGGGRFGMLVDSQGPAAAGPMAVSYGAEQSQRFRADYGVVNLNPGATRIEVVLKGADGAPLAATELVLKALQHLERNLEGIFRDTQVGFGESWTVEARVLSGGPVMTYLANTNVSGDIFFVPGRPLEP